MHMTNWSLILNIPYVSSSLPGVIPDQRAKAPPSESPPPKKKKKWEKADLLTDSGQILVDHVIAHSGAKAKLACHGFDSLSSDAMDVFDQCPQLTTLMN